MLRLTGLAVTMCLVTLPAAASDWQVVPGKSKLGFVATQNDKEFTGEFKSFSAGITFDPQALDEASATVNVDTGSIHMDRPKDEIEAARGPDWFHVKKYPKAVFETTAFRKTGTNSYTAEAKLTIRGVTQKISLPFTLDISGGTAKMHGSVTVNRGAYGVGQGQFSKGKWFGMDVKVVVDLTAKRK
ncbi:MAG: YceI family protein [Alphaproteobacteria bacterium]